MRYCLTLFLLYLALTSHCQVAIVNYVANGGFENKINCIGNNSMNKCTAWASLGQDSSLNAGPIYDFQCFGGAPNTGGNGYQIPKDGETFGLFTANCSNPCTISDARIYPRNRLNSKLVAGVRYCARMYVSLAENSPTAISNLAMCFVDESIDTVKNPYRILDFILAQVVNSQPNIIKDTTSWTAISGTFVANGNEKYLIIGNFSSEAQTNKMSVIPNSIQDWSEYYLDAISCVPIDIPADAGIDKRCIPGDSVFIGRKADVTIDEFCTWYKLPNLATPIATIAGLFVKPINTSTYVVRQQLWCSGVKYDTVVVYKDQVGIEEYYLSKFQIYPNPVQDLMHVKWDANLSKDVRLEVYNLFGQLLSSDNLEKGRQDFSIDVSDLPAGVYHMQIRSENARVRRKFVCD